MLKALSGPANNDFGPLGTIGQTWNGQWVPINDPEAITISTVNQRIAQGGARFRRLEGCWWGENKHLRRERRRAHREPDCDRGKDGGAGQLPQPGVRRSLLQPDGKWLFVNIQTPGITFAITSPWGSGPL